MYSQKQLRELLRHEERQAKLARKTGKPALIAVFERRARFYRRQLSKTVAR